MQKWQKSVRQALSTCMLVPNMPKNDFHFPVCIADFVNGLKSSAILQVLNEDGSASVHVELRMEGYEQDLKHNRRKENICPKRNDVFLSKFYHCIYVGMVTAVGSYYRHSCCGCVSTGCHAIHGFCCPLAAPAKTFTQIPTPCEPRLPFLRCEAAGKSNKGESDEDFATNQPKHGHLSDCCQLDMWFYLQFVNVSCIRVHC